MKIIIQSVVISALLCVSLAFIIKPKSNSKIIPNRYIVTLKDHVDLKKFISDQVLRRNNGEVSQLQSRVKFVYGFAINGFAAELDETELKSLDSLNEVLRISYDQIATIFTTVTQPNSTYGLNQISQTAKISTTGPWHYTYDDCDTGSVTAFVIDTGINLDHVEFKLPNGNSRASSGPNFVTGGQNSSDDNGHGTHVAGIIGGKTYGVAKTVSLVAVKVLDSTGSGAYSQIIAGINYVCGLVNGTSKFVINMSLGGAKNDTINAAVQSATSRNITVVVAAGNGNSLGISDDACKYSPASAPTAITVGACDSAYRLTSYSNCGKCVDIIAPGDNVLSSYIGNATATAVLSGTSMASPHVAGIVAYYLCFNNANTNMTDVVIKSANPNKISLTLLCSNNPLLNLYGYTPNLLPRNDVNLL